MPIESYITVSLNEISSIILGQSPPSTTYNQIGNGLPFYQGKAEFGDLYPSPQKWCSKPKKLAQKGDILISVRAPVGSTNICPDKSCIGRGLASISPKGQIPRNYILYYLRSIESYIDSLGTGTTFKSISGSQLKQIKIPLPPLAEQHRIVEKIEEEFTRLDAGVSALKRAKALIPRYRQSVLKSAMCGDLTKEWRALHPDVESAEILVERIILEREKFGAKKRTVKKELKSLFILPNNWKWEFLGNCLLKLTDGTHHSPTNEESGDYMYISAKNIKNSGISLKRLTYVSKRDHDEIYSRCDPEFGDILFIKDGATTGIVTINNIDEPFSMLSSVALLKAPENINNKYLMYSLRSPIIQNYLKGEISGVAITRVTLSKMNEFLIPLPPLEEQHEIVSEIERRFSIIDEMERVVDESLLKAERLRQSVLKCAFEGRLVPQNPDDEPASVLLERIKLEKEKRAAEGKKVKKSSPAKVRKKSS